MATTRTSKARNTVKADKEIIEKLCTKQGANGTKTVVETGPLFDIE
jgi:hypothetical protein